MKTKIILAIIAFAWTSCSSLEEKKEEKDNSTEEVDAESAPVEEGSAEESDAMPQEEEISEEVIEDLKESNKASNPNAGIGTSSGNGSNAGSGSGVTKKSIEVKSDITVGEEGVR